MQWWGALTQQFTAARGRAMKDGAAEPPRRWPRDGQASIDAAGQPPKKAATAKQARGGKKRGADAAAQAHARLTIDHHEPFLHAPRDASRLAHRAGAGGAQIDAQRARATPRRRPTLGCVYLTDHYAAQAQACSPRCARRWPGVAWVGASASASSASGVEYFDEPALALMLCELPRTSSASSRGARAARRLRVRAPRWCMPTRPRPTWPS